MDYYLVNQSAAFAPQPVLEGGGVMWWGKASEELKDIIRDTLGGAERTGGLMMIEQESCSGVQLAYIIFRRLGNPPVFLGTGPNLWCAFWDALGKLPPDAL